MAEGEAAMADLNSSRDDISYQEMGVDVEGLEEVPQKNPETASQLGTEETDGRTSKRKKKASQQRIIQDGLLLSLKGHKQTFISFTYSLAPGMDTTSRVDWKVLTTEGVECQHIYFHQLQAGDTVSAIAHKHKRSHTVAVILGNTENTLDLPPEFSVGIGKPKKNAFPMVVISSEDGASLRDFLGRHDPGELHAKIESKGQAHVDRTRASSSTSRGGSHSPDVVPKSKLKSGGGGIRQSMRHFRQRRSGVNLKEELKALMFPLSGPVCITEDEELFKNAMITFYQHELAAQKDGSRPGDSGVVFRKLSKHLDEQFSRDFPFYLLVAYRVHKNSTVYQSDELSPFVHSCVDKFEKLEQGSIAKTLEAFLKKDNFKITFSSTEADQTVFKILEDACIELMKLSFELKSQDGSHAKHWDVYHRMLWISVAYKCYTQRGSPVKELVDYWQEHLTNTETFTHLNTDTIQSIKRGVEFGRLLQLPDEVCFSSHHMGDVLTAVNVVRPFHQIREFVIVLEPYVQLEEVFVECFLTAPRSTSYSTHFNSKRNDWFKLVHPEGKLLTILQEGLAFLDTVLDVSRNRQWLSKSMHDEMKEWLTMLLTPIDVTSEKAESYLKDFLTTKTGGVTKLYCEHIKRDVIVKMQDNFNHLKVERFLQLYKAFLIWPTWVVEKYLKQYKIPKEVKICSSTWNEFFSEFVERFKESQHHTFLLEFLKSVAKSYLSQKRAKDFVMDLLELNVPDLFMIDTEGSTSTIHSDVMASTVPDEFMTFLAEYIQRNNLHEPILKDVQKIWGLVVDHSNFQQLILQVLQQELIPESLAYQGSMAPSLKLLLKHCVETVCKNMSSIREMSSRLEFCWGVVGSCCAKMPVTESLEWAKSYYHIIDQLGRIYSIFCQMQEQQETKSVLDEDTMPMDVSMSSCEGVKEFFAWLARAQQVLAAWREKFTTKKINYDSIVLYTEVYSLLSRAATSLTANTLVVDASYVQVVRSDFLQHFEQLNIMLIRYIDGHPDIGYRSLNSILSSYGVELPPTILMAIKQHVTFPGESKNNTKKQLSVERSIPSSISKTFAPGQDIKLEVTTEMDLVQLKNLVRQLTTFLSPVEDNLDLLTFFSQTESEIFDKYLKHQLKILEIAKAPKKAEELPKKFLPDMVMEKKREKFVGVSIELLGEALENTKEFTLRLIQGDARYTEIIASGSLNLRSNIDQEFGILISYAEHATIDMKDAEGLQGIKAMLQLFQYARHIQVIHNVCEQFQLEACLMDSDLLELMELVAMLDQTEMQNQLTAKDAIDRMNKVTELLCLNNTQSTKFLDLFAAVSESADFHQFIVQEKQFVGKDGKELFAAQYQLITTQLQHEEYNEVVLNHLFAAFKMITPFTEKELGFNALMTKVSELNAYDGRRQLDTVNRNINLIRLWFTRAEGDTLQGVSTELRAVLETGFYRFHFSSSIDYVSGRVQLLYQPHLYQNVEEVMEMPSISGMIIWTDEQISDFVRKLGFLDAEGDTEWLIRQFLHLNQTAKKLLDLFTKLRELGHPDFLQEDVKYILHCSFSQEDADKMVYDASVNLSDWKEMVNSLRSEYEQLLFFSIPKLLHLYQNLVGGKPSVSRIVNDVSILFQNNHEVQRKLRHTIKDLIRDDPYLFREQDCDSTPMHVVGRFLSALFQNSDLSTNSLKRRRANSTLTRSLSQQSTHILHSCKNFTPSQLLRTIIGIFGGVPEPFEVFHCRPTVTEEELRLFLNPARATKHPFQYLILEVNKLPYQLQEALVRIYYDLKHQHQAMALAHSGGDLEVPCTHFIETAPSLLQEMPWVLHMDYKGVEPSLDFAQASISCKKAALSTEDFECVKLVYGEAGDGKTHYIEHELRCAPYSLRIAVNEAFTPLSAIKKLSSELPTDVPNCAVYFNFTMLPPGESVDSQERDNYNQLIETVAWFFFDLFILGYVEDPITGYSFRFPGGMKWAIYIEVPSRINMNSEMSLKEFFEDIPALGLLGTPQVIDPSEPYVVDEEVQLVCKYLREFKIGGSKGINKLFKEGGVLSSKSKTPIKFSLDPDLSDSDCHKLLNHYAPKHMLKNKISQKLFIRYMKRRCSFLDNCPAFNYNPGSTEYVVKDGKKHKNDTTHLGSTLMETMLREVSDFCDPIIRENWSLKPHHQLIYDFKDGGGTFGLLSLHPEEIANEDKEKFKKIGVGIPSMLDLYSRDHLDSYLSRALNVPLENNRLSVIDDSQYVLTLDFAIKMLNIHERAECGIPVIIEGETGVGKTALVEMLSKLWNYSLIRNWTLFKERIMEFLKIKLDALPAESLKTSPECVDSIVTITHGGSIREDDLIMIGELILEDGAQFSTVIRTHLLSLVGDPMLSMLDLRSEDLDQGGVDTVTKLVGSVNFKNNPKEIAKVLYKLFNCKVKEFFYKLNVHAALEPAQIVDFFEPIFEKAAELEKTYEHFSDQTKMPFITVFLDEINTSSCLGIFKEVVVDRTIDGKPIPSNVFVMGACNPHRGNSLATVLKKETWTRGTYYVRQLHPTLQCLQWDYGALGEKQEREYIGAKMRMSNQDATSTDQAALTDLILKSQQLMRKYSYEQLQECGLPDCDASDCSRSCVSQRDIQRVFVFYEWLYKMYMRYKPAGLKCDYSYRAVMISLGLVYYLRLDTKYRNEYRKILDHEAAAAQESTFSQSFEEELTWYIEHIDLPDGIAKTQALKENLFATIVCTMTHTPLIIVGQPGSSKTLSFNLCLANLKGQESKVNVFRHMDVFKSLDPQFYQCSRRTTSNEIQTVFSRAINRQRSHQRVPLPVYCVVFMDEAGLPEERHESLKVLHFYLDKQEVSFVAISNHVLDAAKTNRAVSLFRPEVTQEDLMTLAKGCLCQTPDEPPPELRRDLEFVANLVPAYDSLMRREKFKQFFGLRDFIHFISYLKRKRKEMLSPQLVVEALERNFNGVSKKDFASICKMFLHRVQANMRDMDSKNILDILLSSLLDHPEECGVENEMRYKLIIDSSEDGSLMRLLFSTGVLVRDKTHVYTCSDFPGDAQLQKVNTIAAVRHSATEGHTVVLCQTDTIHESFYDLFNRRFHRIDANTGPRYYANIAIGAHIKPCRVHKDFECLVVVKESDLEQKNIPQPFLNRFEKYRLSHELVLEATLTSSPPAMSQLLRAVLKKTHEFLGSIGQSSSIYGLHKDTVSSILLTMLPPLEHDYNSCNFKLPTKSTPAHEVRNRIMELTLKALKESAGFVIPECSAEELERDMREVLNQVLRDSEFAGRILLMTSESYYDSTGDVHKAVVEAFDCLHDPHAEANIHQNVSINALLVISAVTQLLVRMLCKRVMQLMTSDSLCVHHRRVPTSYIQSYLNYQNHFSLKSLVESRLQFVKSPMNANKLICYTRSSQLLHQLPSQYPSPLHQQTSTESVSMLHDLVISDVGSLTFQKLSSFTSFTTINELLKSFVHSKAKRVLMISVNMQETSKDVVNHLRIMIEELETKAKSEDRKLYVILLHFPSSKLSSPCYSSLFLRGWDYTYLDAIGVSAKGGSLIDIREWFKQCYTTSAFSTTRLSIATQLQSLLKEAIPVITSRVYFGRHSAASFNKPMSVLERNHLLSSLFFDKKVGEILCDRFHSYWQPSVMVEYLEKAAHVSQQHETSLSVIDSLQTIFKNLFFDFLVHMVYKMNQGMNIDVLFSPTSSRNVVELFLDVLRIIPIPKLSEIKILGISSNDMAAKSPDSTYAPPKFPFFFLVASDVEKLVDQSRREVNQSVDMLNEYSEPRPSLFNTVEQSRVQVMADMLKIIQTKLEDMMKSEDQNCISLTIRALISSDDLWQQYLEDFTRQKLRLEFGNTGISHKILRAAFGKLETRSAVQRLALLHVYAHMHKVNLAKVVSILRPLDQIEVAVSVLPSLHNVQISSPTHTLLDHSGSEDVLESSEALSVFIISTLFNAISGIGMSCSSSLNPHVGTREEQEIKLWFQAYRDVISMPALKEHIYGSRSVTAEAQHSIMHALFLIIRSKPSNCSENLQQGLKIFNRLFDDYFKATMELHSECPRLGEITAIILEELVGSSPEEGKADCVQLRHIMEGLLAHFFSLHQTSYHSDDIRWLLEMANQQSHWQATYLMSEVVEVEYSADFPSNPDLDTNDSLTVFSDASSPHKLFVNIPISIFKFYLHRILLTSLRGKDDPVHSIMLYFQKTDRTQVHSIISELLFPSEGSDERIVGPYIPTFYQFFDTISHSALAENEVMQQPLAHLYFLTVFENLLSSNFGLPNLIRTSQKIAKQCASMAVPQNQLVLLQIEGQAIVQVIIKEVANHLDLKEDSRINTLYSILEDLNAVLDNPQMGGGDIGGHGLVLTMHMLKEQQSFSKFFSLLTENYSHLCDSINCLQPFNKALTQASSSILRCEAVTSTLEIGPEFQTLYQRVTTAMNNIHLSHGTPSKAKELTRIMDECSSSSAQLNIVTSTGQQATMKKSSCFKMALWLVTYHEFFAKSKSAPELAQVVSALKKVESNCLQLVCCFLDPSRMIKAEEETTTAGGNPDSPRQGSFQDPLYQLFCPLSPNEDQSDSDLRAVLVHLIAVTLGCPKSSHLWYSIFHIDDLLGTYLSGFMYDSVVGPNGQFYDTGVELTAEGLYGRHDYLKHVTRGTLSLHSLYLILWSNFASFSLALLTQPKAEANLAGKILSNSEPAREYCVAQMKKLWVLLRNGLGVSDEERLLLVKSCLNNLLEVQSVSRPSNGLTGRLTTSKELDAYEALWHTKIFTPAWNSLEKQFSQKSSFLKLPVIKDIRNMNMRYPWFPSEHTLAMSVLSNANLGDPSGDLYPLSKFVLEYPRLKGGMELLPGIVELYQYLHTEFTYAITYKEATTITLKRLGKVIAKHFVANGDRKAHYEKLKSSFNKYVQLTGCTKYKRPATVGDDTPLLHLLSYSVDGEQGSDLLYTVIMDIIKFLNKFVRSLMETLESTELGRCYFPNTIPKVHVMEYAQHYMLTLTPHRRNNLLQLVLGRSHLPVAFPTDPASQPAPLPHHSYLPGQLSPLINLVTLQEDVLVTCLAGMPLIEHTSVSSMRIPFKFRDDSSAQLSLRDHAVDLEAIAEKLPEQFKIPLGDKTRKRLEFEFHSACYHTDMEVMAGLRTSIGHLIKEVSAMDFDVKSSELLRKTLPLYLAELYQYDPQDESKDVFHEIGIHGITQSQHEALSNLSLPRLFSALRLFVNWAEDGWYDFCSLPFAAKVPMSLPDDEAIRKIPGTFDGTLNQLLHNLKTLVDVLIHMENSIVKTVTEKSRDSIIRYLMRFTEVLPRDIRTLTDMIPRTVLLENYVSLRITLRSLTSDIQAQVSRSESNSPEPKDEKWSDLVDDLWENHLPYFRKRGYVVSSRPGSANSFSNEPDPSSTILNELTRHDSDQNLLELLKKDVPIRHHQVPPSPIPDSGANKEERNLALLKTLTTQVKADEMQRLSKNYPLSDVVEFLNSKNLGHYANIFQEFDINGELLIQFHDDELCDIGIESALDRLRISTYFRRHVAKSEGLAELYPVEVVVKFLQDTRPLQQFATSFGENRIDGEMLLNASDEVMTELGVEKGVHKLMIRQKFKARLD